MALVLAAAILVAADPGLAPAQLQMLLLTVVVIGTVTFGAALGLVAATTGFGVILWHSVRVPAGLTLTVLFDAFVWFAVAKLTAALIGLQRRRLVRQVVARQAAEVEAVQQGLLFDEMKHRVGNDLQRLVAMLHAQAGTEPQAAPALKRAAGRIQVLGRLHERLSRRATGAMVDSRGFLEGLTADLRAGIEPGRPVTLVAAAEEHPLPLPVATDLGLVVNELVTNALKHGFPGAREGLVRIIFRRDAEEYALTVSDNGVGMATEEPAAGSGQRLLRGLAAQLGGRIEVRRGEVGGTHCTVLFPVVAQAGSASLLQPANEAEASSDLAAGSAHAGH